MIKQSFLAAKVKEELRELKRNQQHRANLQTQASIHDSSKIIEAGEEMQLVPHPVQLQEAIKTHPQL